MSGNSWYRGEFDSSVECSCNIRNKKESTRNYVSFMLDRTLQMFEYKGLPDTIPAYALERYLQLNGQVCITKIKGNLYALPGNLGGAPDPYFRPTLYVMANPVLGSANLKILNHLDPAGTQSTQGECVLVKNDSQMEGLMYVFKRYATQLAENDISIRCAQINSRKQEFISAGTDRELASANEYIKGIEDGELKAVMSNEMIAGIKAANVSPSAANSIIQLIELQQYLKASWFNEIGLNATFNMKREYMSEEELHDNTDVLLPLIDNMLQCRKDAMDLVNSTYGTNITVSKNSAWENKQESIDVGKEQEEAKVEEMGGDSNG